MLTRRRFVGGVVSGLGLAGFAGPHRLFAASARKGLSVAQQKWLLEVLPSQDQKFDPFARMLVSSAASGPGYHSTLKSGDVRATRPSLTYAAALLDTGVGWRITRAKEILRSVIALQDQEPTSKTYGLWPWYLEEPLDRMSPPDWNWADFCGAQLLMAWIGNSDKLGAGLANDVREAIVHAARSIQRRNVSPGYTNIAILGTYVTLVAAQEFKLADLRAYAKERLRRLYDYVLGHGSLAEYNSPTYTVIALQELSRLLLHVRDGRDRTLITAVHDLAWRHAATHFHAPTRQWAGPHSRSYETDLRKRPATLAFLQAACDGKVNFQLPNPFPLSLDACRLPLQCPRKWARHFAQLDGPRQVIETFVKAEYGKPGSLNPVTGTTWLHPRLTLGSVNRGDFWKQRRPLLAYWGTPAAPRFLRARFLKNDDDFTSALLFSIQHESAVLAAVVFAIDHGDSHPSLDPIADGTINAKDFRLRFELGGESGAVTIQSLGDAHKSLVLQDREVRWLLRPVADSFGGDPFSWDQPELKLADRIDAVAYHGEEKTLKLDQLTEAFVCFTLEEWSYEQKQSPEPGVQVQKADRRLRVRWATRGKTLGMDVTIRFGSFHAMNDSFRSGIA
jgi:hypothetical protein